jgi:hypothetical protein
MSPLAAGIGIFIALCVIALALFLFDKPDDGNYWD